MGWVVEQAMAKTGTYEDAYETVEEQRLEERLLNLLVTIQPFNHEIGSGKTSQPA